MSELILLGERIKLIHLQQSPTSRDAAASSATPAAPKLHTVAKTSETLRNLSKATDIKTDTRKLKEEVFSGGGKIESVSEEVNDLERRRYRGVKIYNLTVSQVGLQDENLRCIRSANEIGELRRLQARLYRQRAAPAASGARVRSGPSFGTYEQHCRRLKLVNTRRNRSKLHVFNQKYIDSVYQEFWGDSLINSGNKPT